ncbi:MAG: tail fiber domain-containing protein [Alphaproteobacteria bacterium]|nr:tail fiber domain-containing protein [Alphaproteobacteria bacterium]
MKYIAKLSMIALLSTSLTSCALLHQIRSYCQVQPGLCIFVSVVTAGVIISALASSSAAAGVYYPYYTMSDRRLKTHVRRVKTLDNGIVIYSYRYKGDNRNFVGVMAQDVQKLKKFRHAVRRNAQGYLEVNYAKLGLKLYEPKLMAQAGRAAQKRAIAAAN